MHTYYWHLSNVWMACHKRAFTSFIQHGTREWINFKVCFFNLVAFGANDGSVEIGPKDEEELEKETVESNCWGIRWSHINSWDRLYLWQVAHDLPSIRNNHGLIMIRELTLLDRLLWFLVVLAFLALASVLTWDTWTQWQKNQVKNMPIVQGSLICPKIVFF